jgi:resuscitation-promoting factor RpfB
MRALLAAAVTVAAACTPAEITAYLAVTEPARTVAETRGLDAGGLARLRWCESRGDYQAVSRTGTYRGAYQFSRATWNVVAARHYPWLVGVDPIAAEWWWQDAMAQALWQMPGGGRSHWPVCGNRV